MNSKTWICWFMLVVCPGVSAFGQTEPPEIEVALNPPEGSLMASDSVNRIRVTIGNHLLFTNLAVIGDFDGQGIVFTDDGQPPDETAADGVFSGELVTPLVEDEAIRLTLSLEISGELLPVEGEEPPEDPVISETTYEVEYVIVPRPENDRFVNAIKIPADGALILATNNFASLEPDEPIHANVPTVDRSVWWTWSSPVDTTVLIDLSGSSFNGVLAIYTGTALDNLVEVDSDTHEATEILGANVVMDAVPGVTYRICVAGFDADEMGDVYLRVVPGGEPDSTGPTVTILSPETDSLFTNNLVAFSGTAKDDQPDGIGLRRVFLQVNSDDPVETEGAASWSAELSLPPGTNSIQAFAEDIAGNIGQPAFVTVIFMNPTNDHFASAIDLAGLSATINAINGRATKEADEPLHVGNEGGHSIWYRFRAPVRGTLFLSTTNSSFDTLLAVYSGDALTNLTLVAENDDASPDMRHSEVSASLASNAVCYIAVDGYGGESGNIELSYMFFDIEQYYLLTVNPPLGGSASPLDQAYIDGTTGIVTATPAQDFEFIGWEGAVTSTDNPLSLVMTQDYALTAVFGVLGYTDGFESGDLNSLSWSTSGNAQWQVQSDEAFGGGFAARSGGISDSQLSTLTLSVTLREGTGVFRYRVSSEEGWDFLEFLLNGVRLGRWSGEAPWDTFKFTVRAGQNTLLWRYSKDANFSEGLDAAFLDNLYLPLAEIPAAPELMMSILDDGSLRLNIQGLPGRPHVIEVSNNLSDWVSVTTETSPDGLIQWIDPESGTEALRFYRVYVD